MQAQAVIKIESHQNESSFAANDGSIDITATGTAGPFTFQWSDINNTTTEDISGLTTANHAYPIPNCDSDNPLVELWCGPQQGNGDNFIGFRCFGCGLDFIDIQLQTTIQPNFCEFFPCICDPSACEFVLPTPIITNVAPNPFYGQFDIQFNSPTDKIEVVVSDALGRIVYQKDLEPQIGENSITVILENTTPTGMYFVSLKSPNGTQATKRIVHLESN
jgi:hypothetical protein